MRDTTKKKQGAVISAAVAIAFLLVYLIVMAALLLLESEPFVIGIVGFYGLLIIVVIGGIALALHQRIKEINGGEEEAAKQY